MNLLQSPTFSHLNKKIMNRGTSCRGYGGTVGMVPNLLGLILGGEGIIVSLPGSSL